MLEDRAITRVDGAMAFVSEDEIEGAGREPWKGGHRRRIGGGEDARSRIHLAGFDAREWHIWDVLLERTERLLHQLATVGKEEDALDPLTAHEQIHQGHRDARFSGT